MLTPSNGLSLSPSRRDPRRSRTANVGAVAAALVGGLVVLSVAIAEEPCFPAWTDAGASLLPGSHSSPVLLDMAEFDPDGPGPLERSLTVSGTFRFVDAPARNSIAKWNGYGWEDVGTTTAGPNPGQSIIYALREGPDVARTDGRRALYAAGTFRTINGVQANLVAKWDGAQWTSFAALPDIVVWALTIHDFDGPSGPLPPRLVIGGVLVGGPTNTLPGVRYWDGADWQPVGGSSRCHVKGLTSFDPDGDGPLPSRLFASRHTVADGQDGIAEWTGGRWVKMVDQTSDFSEFKAFDPDGAGPLPATLYAATDTRLLRLNDLDQWVSEGIPALTLAVLPASDAGSGLPTLLAAGFQSTMKIWRLGSSGWTLFVNGLDRGCGGPYALRAFDEDGAGPRPPALFVGGCMNTFAGVAVSSIARFGCAPIAARCLGDADGSGAVDFHDVVVVLSRWGALEQPGDMDRDGVVGMNDIIIVLSTWGDTCNATASAQRPENGNPGADQWRALGIEDFTGDGAVTLDDYTWALAHVGLDPRSPFDAAASPVE